MEYATEIIKINDLSSLQVKCLLQFKASSFKLYFFLRILPQFVELDYLNEIHLISSPGVSLLAQTVKPLPAMRETWVQSLGCEDPLEKGKAAYSSILAWRILWLV